MLPSETDIANFIAFAPEADEGKAFVFLEGSNSVEEAVTQFYENPDKYSESAAAVSSMSSMSTPMASASDAKEAKTPIYSPPPYAPPPETTRTMQQHRPHTNPVIQAGHVRARDEQEMQNLLQSVQMANGIYNSDIEPEHEFDGYCNCAVHQYKYRKMARLDVQKMWSKAVLYPGEKAYHDCYQASLFTNNPYRYRIVSPYGNFIFSSYYVQKPSPSYYASSVHQTIALNAALNQEAQSSIDAKEPRINIWNIEQLESSMSKMTLATDSSSQADEEEEPPVEKGSAEKGGLEKSSAGKRQSMAGSVANSKTEGSKPSRFATLKKAVGMKSPEEKAVARTQKMGASGRVLRNAILEEEQGRWPTLEWRQIVATYQEKVGMTQKIAHLRAHQPTQYLHLLRAGYFEPIPVAWANLASNPLKFSIEAAAGWRGITPAWRGYEDTAEERLYWVLNHREGGAGVRIKPDIISTMNMARARMASAVEPPPAYYSPNDICHVQHTSEGYSKQVMPAPFIPFDAPEVSTDDTMILLDVSGSMDFVPVRPVYNQYLITGYTKSTQPKNKDVAKAIIRRFTDAMANHDHNFRGYDFTTFANQAKYIGVVNHQNLDAMWQNVRIGGGTRVMTGWQKIKDLHFQKHSESATHHPVYGWQAGPRTPMLRMLLLLDGEATDMDEFELDLLGLSWVHVTIFLIGVDGCPHHHRHANELQRISQVNHHVSFVDAQGNTPERFVTHELLKRHLGYEVTMSEFEELEQPPPYAG
ncbi:hypothetical protein LHYA1_G004663 [Lachnellula hyalina]|uniref:VWFA domain-containing protein n=1 Tax=Lachnellula hyalina TaxID=1316788 RepID=A0A8H8R2B5_9HELO|nr:uncharacterized protein LHYA1_G004663 [Lachnellula hyalina]TVY27212.1 hypothetical protein LHYA1_G004663 [Lachnellula hyalina]